MYNVKLEINDQTLEVEGKTLLSALKKLKKPTVIKTAGLIKISEGKRYYERIMNIPRLKSMFNDTNPIYKEVFAKNFELFLK